MFKQWWQRIIDDVTPSSVLDMTWCIYQTQARAHWPRPPGLARLGTSKDRVGLRNEQWEQRVFSHYAASDYKVDKIAHRESLVHIYMYGIIYMFVIRLPDVISVILYTFYDVNRRASRRLRYVT